MKYNIITKYFPVIGTVMCVLIITFISIFCFCDNNTLRWASCSIALFLAIVNLVIVNKVFSTSDKE